MLQKVKKGTGDRQFWFVLSAKSFGQGQVGCFFAVPTLMHSATLAS